MNADTHTSEEKIAKYTEKIKKYRALLEEEEQKNLDTKTPASGTRNTKGNRKIVRADYQPQVSFFKIPDGLDLEDKSIVEMWHVKWDILGIRYVGGKEEKIRPFCRWEDDEDLFKQPEYTHIQDDIPWIHSEWDEED